MSTTEATNSTTGTTEPQDAEKDVGVFVRLPPADLAAVKREMYLDASSTAVAAFVRKHLHLHTQGEAKEVAK